MKERFLTLSLLVIAVPVLGADSGELLPPVPIMVGERPLDVEREGHAAPFVGDFDGDGVMDLLVGQFDGGRLRIYRNKGSNSQPKFDSYTWFEAGDKIASVPVG
jgi:hypothetical protein